MIGDEENIGFDLNNKESGFRYYRIIVKTMSQDQILHQNIEIYTNGLRHLLELRRMHSQLFSDGAVENFKSISLAN